MIVFSYYFTHFIYLIYKLNDIGLTLNKMRFGFKSFIFYVRCLQHYGWALFEHIMSISFYFLTHTLSKKYLNVYLLGHNFFFVWEPVKQVSLLVMQLKIWHVEIVHMEVGQFIFILVVQVCCFRLHDNGIVLLQHVLLQVHSFQVEILRSLYFVIIMKN